MTLDQLLTQIKRYAGTDVVIESQGDRLGNRTHTLRKNGFVRATWNSRLLTIPPLDGVTPRGPSDYYDLKHLQ